MRNINYFLLIFLIAIGSCNSQKSKINGVSYVAYNKPISKENVVPVKLVNANFAALMPFAFVKNLNNPNVIFNSSRQWFGETPEGIKQYAKELRKEEIQIMIKPQIWVFKGEFTGFIEMDSEENWKSLENSYKKFILEFAKIAEEIHAEIFCIGTELEKFVINRPDFWIELIKEVKRVYKGKLTYAANWNEYNKVHFWNELDFIGIDAYFPLSDKKNPTVLDFRNGWKNHKQNISNFRKTYNKPVLFTEYGYRSVFFTGKEPWNSDRNLGEINLKNQENALRAIYQEFWNEPWFSGGFVWKWFIDHNKVGGKTNTMFTPQNKPAETVLRELYKN